MSENSFKFQYLLGICNSFNIDYIVRTTTFNIICYLLSNLAMFENFESLIGKPIREISMQDFYIKHF